MGARAWWGMVVLGLVMAAASAGAQTAPAVEPGSPADVQSLRERAAAFWAARVAKDYQAQWQLLEPRARYRMSAEEYAVGKGVVRYLAYQVEDASVRGAFATVKVRLLTQTQLPAAMTARAQPPVRATVLDDGWIRVAGIWYRRLDQPDESQSGSAGQ